MADINLSMFSFHLTFSLKRKEDREVGNREEGRWEEGKKRGS